MPSPAIAAQRSRVPLALGAALWLASIGAPIPCRAGAWTREAGGWFLKLGYDRWFTGERFDSAGARVRYRELGAPALAQQYRAHALRAYAEYGLTPGWTAIASGGYEWLALEGGGVRQSNFGLSDLRLGVKRRLFATPLVASVASDVKLPLGALNGRAPALGSEQVDVGGRLALGGSVQSIYASAAVGYRLRGGALANQVPFEAEAGWSALQNVLVRASLRGTWTTRERDAGAGRFDPALADSRDLIAGAGLVLRGSPLDLVFEAERVLEGRNALAGTRLAFSVWHTRPGSR